MLDSTVVCRRALGCEWGGGGQAAGGGADLAAAGGYRCERSERSVSQSVITTLLPTEHMAHCTLDLLGAAGSLD